MLRMDALTHAFDLHDLSVGTVMTSVNMVL